MGVASGTMMTPTAMIPLANTLFSDCATLGLRPNLIPSSHVAGTISSMPLAHVLRAVSNTPRQGPNIAVEIAAPEFAKHGLCKTSSTAARQIALYRRQQGQFKSEPPCSETPQIT